MKETNLCSIWGGAVNSLQLRHNGCDSVSNNQPHDCLLFRLFKWRSKKTSKLRVTASLAFVRGIHRSPANSPHKWPVTRKMFPFDDVIVCNAFVFIACPDFSDFSWNVEFQNWHNSKIKTGSLQAYSQFFQCSLNRDIGINFWGDLENARFWLICVSLWNITYIHVYRLSMYMHICKNKVMCCVICI